MEALLRFERLLSDTTAQLLNVAPEDLDATIQASLSAVGAYLGSERGGIALFSEDGRSLIYKYGFFVPGTDTALYETDLARAVPWYAGELRAGRRVILPRLPEGLPLDALAERAHVAAIGLKSAFGLPLRAGAGRRPGEVPAGAPVRGLATTLTAGAGVARARSRSRVRGCVRP